MPKNKLIVAARQLRHTCLEFKTVEWNLNASLLDASLKFYRYHRIAIVVIWVLLVLNLSLVWVDMITGSKLVYLNISMSLLCSYMITLSKERRRSSKIVLQQSIQLIENLIKTFNDGRENSNLNVGNSPTQE